MYHKPLPSKFSQKADSHYTMNTELQSPEEWFQKAKFLLCLYCYDCYGNVSLIIIIILLLQIEAFLIFFSKTKWYA